MLCAVLSCDVKECTYMYSGVSEVSISYMKNRVIYFKDFSVTLYAAASMPTAAAQAYTKSESKLSQTYINGMEWNE